MPIYSCPKCKSNNINKEFVISVDANILDFDELEIISEGRFFCNNCENEIIPESGSADRSMIMENPVVRYIVAAATVKCQKYSSLRMGQAVYNISHYLDVDIAESLAGSDSDCFYNNNNMSDFLYNFNVAFVKKYNEDFIICSVCGSPHIDFGREFVSINYNQNKESDVYICSDCGSSNKTMSIYKFNQPEDILDFAKANSDLGLN